MPLIEVPKFEEISAIDAEIESLNAEIDVVLRLVWDKRIEGEEEFTDRVMTALVKAKNMANVTRAGLSMLAVESTEESKGQTQ